MKLKGFTQQSLADELAGRGVERVSQRAVSNWLREGNPAEPHAETVPVLATIFGIDSAILIDDDFDLPEGTTTALYKGEYKVTPEMAAQVRESVEQQADAKLLSGFASQVPKLVTRLDALANEVLAIRAELAEYAGATAGAPSSRAAPKPRKRRKKKPAFVRIQPWTEHQIPPSALPRPQTGTGST